MSPLGVVDALDVDLTRRRFRLAAAAGSWVITRSPHRRAVRRVHAARTLVELDTLLAFGVVPVSVGSDGGARSQSWRAIASEADIDVIDVGDPGLADRLLYDGIDLAVVSEAVARTAPREVDIYLDLGIPVVPIPDADVAGQVSGVGEALGMADRASTLAAEVVTRLRRFVPTRRPSSVSAFTACDDGSVHVFTPASPLGALLRRLGLPELTGPPTGEFPGAHTVAVAPAEFAVLDAEVTIGLETASGTLAGIEADPRFAVLPVVRRGGYRRLDPVSSYAVAVPSVLTVPVALETVAAVLRG